MSIELAEKLKAKLTDKWVVVDAAVPELKRFAQWTGKVRTVNMNCRALVEFDGPVDIGWYDIDPAFLTVVDAPKPKVKEAKPAAEKKPAAAATPKPAAGGSPLDAIRAAGAAKPAAAAPAAGKPSPLDLIRQQQAAKQAGGAPAPVVAAAAPVAEAPPTAPAPAAPVEKPAAPTTAPDGRKLSPLEMIRAQGAAKR